MEPFPDKIGEVCVRKVGTDRFLTPYPAIPVPKEADGPLLYLGDRTFLALESNSKIQIAVWWQWWEEFAKPLKVKKR